jgi:hypothetical protein
VTVIDGFALNVTANIYRPDVFAESVGTFASNQAPGTLIEAASASFLTSITGSYDMFTVTSSLVGSETVTHPTLVQRLENGLRTATATQVTINGVDWFVGLGCRIDGGFDVE